MTPPRAPRSALAAALCWTVAGLAAGVAPGGATEPEAAPLLHVGAAAVTLEADDKMPIAGGIHPGRAGGQEGELRAVAVVLEQAGVKLAIVAVDILMVTREVLDPVVAEIGARTGIPAAHVLINCTHTHHAPSTLQVHGYAADGRFTERVAAGVVEAVVRADAALKAAGDPCTFHFHLGHEATVGQNSRQLLPDGSIYWIGRRDRFVRPTGPFDPEFPVLAFRGPDGRDKAVLFNHSTHLIGTVKPGVRSPSFYGLAAQAVEAGLDPGAVVGFLAGACGSTHDLRHSCGEMEEKVRATLTDGLARAQPRPVPRLAAAKRAFRFRVRTFDEAAEEAAVTAYCRKWVGGYGEAVIPVFRRMREQLAPHQGEERETWVQALAIGDVALVGVPAEFFTTLGLDIKNRSPYRYTYIAELANDWIGYLPDRDAHRLGGYQVWTGFHSYAEPGTGERMVDAAVELLQGLKASGEEKPRGGGAAPPPAAPAQGGEGAYRLVPGADGGSALETPDGRVVFRYLTRVPEGSALTAASAACLFPLNTPSGERLVDFAPPDHRHHRGVFLAWHSVTAPSLRADFWGWGEWAPTAGRVIENRSVELVSTSPERAVVRVVNAWTAGGQRLIDEVTELAVHEDRGAAAFVIDADIRLTPSVDLTLDQTAFGGFNVKCRQDGDGSISGGPGAPADPPAPHHLKPLRNVPGPWYDYTIALRGGGKRVGVTVIDHPGNPPALWHNVPAIAMVNPCIVAPGPVRLNRGEPLRLRYRLVARDGPLDRARTGALAEAFRGR